jgi:signal transduction histidine kinase/HAMP domain-containing protein
LEEASIMFLPDWLNLDSLSIIRLAALLLSLAISVYLFLVPKKTLATLFLAGVFFGAFLFNTASFFEFAGPYYWQPRTLKTVLVLLFTDIGPSLAMVFLLFFAYYFPRFRRVERKEFRIVLALSIVLNAGVLGLNVYNHFVLQWQFSDTRLWDIYWLTFYCSLGIQFLGAIVLLFRKAARLSGRGSRSFLDRIIRPHSRDAESARALGAIILLPMLAVAASLAVTYGALPFSLANYLTWLGLLLFYLGFVVTYLNYSADPMTLQVKLLGVTLVLILSTMGLVALFVGETSASDYPRRSLLPEHSTILFTLNESRSYDIRGVPDGFDPDLGPKVDFVYGRPHVMKLGFNFPFYEASYRTIHVLNGPMIFLGERVLEKGWGGYNPQPAIAPLIMNLDPSRGGGIHLKSSPDSVTVTWYRLPELGAENVNTIQLVLRVDGTIEMSFEELSPASGPSVEQLYNYTAASTTGGDPAPGRAPAPFPPRLTGIHPGGSSAPLEPVSFTHGLPWSGTRPAVIFESHEAGFARYLNDRIGVLAALTLGSSLLVLLLIPLLLRASLFTPLRALSRGMRQVESSDLDAAVKVQSRDEIGSLARSFNRMVESIRRAESSFRALAEDAQDGIIVFSDDAAVYANRRAAEMTGYPISELSRTRFDALFRSAALPPYGVLPDAPAEALAATASGAALSVELVYSQTLWHGRPAIAVLVRDITRRKREEEMARLQLQNFMRTDKLTSLGVLAAGLAHEINVPNQVILSNATLLSSASPQLAAMLDAAAAETEGHLIGGLAAAEFHDRLPEMLSAVVKSSTLIGAIIRNLRDFSADSPGRDGALFDVNTAIRNAVDLVGAYIRRSTDRFTLELHSGLPRTRGSAQRLEQVFINLILNACQSIGGRDKAITVRSRPGETSATLQVTVSDEGAGIPEEILPRVREAFFTTREASGGTGLGLYVSQAIVTAHGGTLELSSKPGVGTEAKVILPAEAQE